MPRLFIGNFDFEHRLADPTRQLPARLERINAELATSWLAIAEDGDYVWTPEPIDGHFFERAVADGLPRVIPVTSFDRVPRDVTCVPWGWTDDIRRLCDKQGWARSDPPDTAVRATNSRRLSASLEEEWGIGLDGAGVATSLAQIEQLVMTCGECSRWVIKAEFGMSGRERLIGRGTPTTSDRQWIEKRLQADGVVFFEPWVTRLSEVGIQIDVPAQGEPMLVGITPLDVDQRGQYTGSAFEDRDYQYNPGWTPAVEIALRTAHRIQNLGYFGPLGIDVMNYRTPDGSQRLRSLQDINARWTMGRLSLGWKRLLKPGESGFWLHGSQFIEAGSTVTGRRIQTSPDTVGNLPVTHKSCLWIEHL